MDFTLTEEQRAFQEAARTFARNEMLPHAARWDEEHIFPRETLQRAAELGFAGIYVREDVGGSALSRLDAAIIFEELSAACPSTAAFLSIHNMVAWMIDRFGTEEQRQHYLPAMMTMETIGGYALTEPDAGSDAASLKTRASRDGEVYALNGSKAFTSGGGTSNLYVVMARTGEAGPRGISAILVPSDTQGLSYGKQEKKMGWHSQPTAGLLFENAKVPVGNRLGNEGEGFRIAMMALDGGRLNIGACSLGPARACLDASLDYLRERRQFGQRLADFQTPQFKLADMRTKLEASRLLLHMAASKLDDGASDATTYCAMAKRLATDTGFEVCNEALQLHGGYGYLRDYPIERYLRDVRVHQILEGTNEIMRLIIARRMLAE